MLTTPGSPAIMPIFPEGAQNGAKVVVAPDQFDIVTLSTSLTSTPSSAAVVIIALEYGVPKLMLFPCFLMICGISSFNLVAAFIPLA